MLAGIVAGVLYLKRGGAVVPGPGGLEIGDVVDEFNGVKIYYNGPVGNSVGRRRAADGYNFGQGFQCVEFVKRYYYEKLDHRMPDTWGHAKDFFDREIPNGMLNPKRDLVQFRNGEGSKPKEDDLMILGPSLFNSYGHVAIVSKVGNDQIEIAQQNHGPSGASRVTMPFQKMNGEWRVGDDRVLGWLRMP